MKKEISTRLQNIAEMVTPGNVVYDVGCDHGFLTIYLVEYGIAQSAYAMDVRKGPLAAARDHVKEAGLESQITCILSDGLQKAVYPHSPSTLILAGMGGPLILRILSNCPQIRDAFKEIILSPQSQIDEFRQGLQEQSIAIADERMVIDENKYYVIMRCIPKQDNFDMDALDYRYGPILMADKNPVLGQFLIHERDVLQNVHDRLNPDMHADRLEEVDNQIHMNQEALRRLGLW